ncbi:alpha/beta hydrolase [Celeribacter indicus]|uniref:Lipoprotein n=1 Tax=Celeribacter indicus TaxID=1208324 RepID=A0A0B5DVR4_9RHOB|nr:alpha/beta fold hydrolase [Celeribacter indicus]AJE47089.1 hypothetical protein P73_2374 [Celeribacter indicus]SDW91216.1 Esterase/lipase superfamily enzyme [Celeribacter indicus]
MGVSRFLLMATLALSACTARPAPEVLAPQGVAAPAAADVVRIHVVTTRERMPDRPYAFGADRAPEPSYAAFDISIPPQHQPGVIEWPAEGRVPDPATAFVTLRRTDLDRAALLRAASNTAAGVYVHGFNTSFQEALYRTAQMSADVEIEGVPILFSWPSEAHVAAYLTDRDAADYSRDALADLLAQLAAPRRPDDPLLVLAHSMGARLTMEAMRQLRLTGQDAVLNRLEVVLAAPDIDLDLFREQMTVIGSTRHPVSVLVSSDDRTLEVSSRLSSRRTRLGLVDVHDPRVQEAARAMGVRVIDITSLPSSDIPHRRYLGLISSGEIAQVETALGGIREAGAFVFDSIGLTLRRIETVLTE